MDYKFTRYTLYKNENRNSPKQEPPNPQKDFLKKICDYLFYLGVGNCWYEERNLSKTQQLFYNIYAIIANVYLLGNYFNEILGNLRTDLSTKERNDIVQFTLAHFHVLIKIALLYLMKNRIRIFLKRFCEREGEFAYLDLDLKSVIKAKKYVAPLVISMYSTIFATTVDGIRLYVKEGIPIQTEIVYFPNSSQSGIFINILRLLVMFHWWYLVTIMVLIDAICTASLVFVGFKFRTLKLYFQDINTKLQGRSGENLKVLEEDYKKDFIVGIKIHKEALWAAQYAQHALGNLYSIQVMESIILIVTCLVKMVTVERNLTFLVANLSYITCMVIVTACYMMSAGDIIFEAEELPTGIFQSGWNLTASSQKLRTLVVVALIRSQRPVFMTAFGIFILSYNNFITILRASYSFFAVMY